MSGYAKLTMSGFAKLTMSGFAKLTMSGLLREPSFLRAAPPLQVLDVPAHALGIPIREVDALSRIGVEIEQAGASRVDGVDELQRAVAESKQSTRIVGEEQRH